MNGQLVSTLVESQQQSGIVTLPWDGKNVSGVQVSSGKYITEIALTYANGRTEVKRESVVVAR
jgi:flagellar hook assembly protein FlgD